MLNPVCIENHTLDTEKFRDPETTAKGEKRGRVPFERLATLWFNTGTLCNLACRGCYIGSSPTNDSLEYLTLAEAVSFLDEIRDRGLPTEEIGFTGGEPFMNPDIVPMLNESLARAFRVLVLTNAMKPMARLAPALLDLKHRHGERLTIRVSLDHHGPALHEVERGPKSWQPTLDGLIWLARNGFRVHVAGRTCWSETEADLRRGYANLFAEHGVPIDALDRDALVLFPEMQETADVPEITEHCWSLLKVSPADMMCATARMVIKRRGATAPSVVACTLLPDDPQFEVGNTLAEAAQEIRLNHRHCARFCVLGGGSCSRPTP